MKKTIGKSIFAAIAIGLLSTSYVLADTVNQSVSTNHSKVTANSKHGTPNMDNASVIIQKPRTQLVGWPLMTQDGARNFKGIVEATEKLPYEAQAPSYIPYGYQLYTTRHDRNDVLEVVYYQKGAPIYQAGQKFITNAMAYRMGYSLDTVRDTAYIPAAYGDFEWSEQGESGTVYYTGNPETHMVRSIAWAQDGMAYSLFFLEPVKAADAEFYKEYIVPVKTIDSSRYELLGNYPSTKISAKTIDEYNRELMERYRWYDQLDNGDVVHHNVDASINDFGYDLQIPSYMPKDYAVRDVKAKDHDVLEIVYTETGHDGEYGPKLTFSNTDIVYRMGWAIDTVVKPILEKTNYNAKDAASFTTANGISVHTLGSSQDAIQIAYWEKDNKVYMLYFASLRNQNFVSKIVDSVGPLTNVGVDDTRLRGDRNDKQNIEENDAKKVKQNDEPVWPHYETIGLPWRTHTNSEWPILTSKSIGLPSGVIDASHKVSYDVSVPSYLPLGYTYYATHFYDNDVLETVYWKDGQEYQERSGRWVNHTMVFRMSYSMDTVWPEEYIPREYHDVQWTDSTPTGDVHYTGDVDKGLVRSVTWYKDNMAYFLFFQVPVKASEADFYKDHVVPLKDIDPNRTDLIGVKTIR